ncbi:MAG: hypothetical protein IJE08_07440 [Clostridia bacterium]|nr:hypothetical protein [Clostridia bacterium]
MRLLYGADERGMSMAYQGRMPDMEEIYNEYFSSVYNYVFYKLLNR